MTSDKLINLSEYVEVWLWAYKENNASRPEGYYLFSKKDLHVSYGFNDLDIDLINTEDNIIKMVIKYPSCYKYIEPCRKTKRVKKAYNKMRI